MRRVRFLSFQCVEYLSKTEMGKLYKQECHFAAICLAKWWHART